MTEDCISIAKALIKYPSVTPDDHGAQSYLSAQLVSMGFRVQRLRFDGDGGDTVDNFYARYGTDSPHLAFAGHTDVVPVGDRNAWTVDPFAGVVKEGYLYGRGAEDMKGAIACFVSAVQQFLEQRTLNNKPFKGSISFIITGDEEGYAINGTRKVVKWMREHGEIPDVCIVGEPTNPSYIGEMVKIGRRGSMNFVLTVKGKQGHVAYPHLADNPMTRLIALLHHLKADKIDDGMEFFQPSNLEVTSVDVGNMAKNVIPGIATARFNIRFNPLHTSDSMTRWVRERCEKYLGGGWELEVRVTGEAFITTPGAFSDSVAAAVKAASGQTPQLSTTGGTSDARFIKDLCPVVEFGATGFTPHMADERVKVADLHTLTKCYLEILNRYFK